MADTIRRGLSKPDNYLDDRLEAADCCARRAIARHQLRGIYRGDRAEAASLAWALSLKTDTVLGCLGVPCFGMAWEAVELAAPLLRHHPVPVADLSNQTQAAQRLLAAIRLHLPETLSLQSLAYLGYAGSGR